LLEMVCKIYEKWYKKKFENWDWEKLLEMVCKYFLNAFFEMS